MEIHLYPGEQLRIVVHGEHTKPIEYELLTPIWGQDDGWGGNLIAHIIKGALGEPDDIAFIGGEDRHIDFGAEGEAGDTQKYVRLCQSSQ